MNQSLEFCESFLRVIVALEAGGAFELRYHWIERAVLMIRGAVETQNRRIGQPIPKGTDQTRLADTWLS